MSSRPSFDLALATVALFATALGSTTALAEPWLDLGPVFEGTQFDVVRGEDRLHIATTQYLEMSSDGEVLLSEALGDVEQSPLFHAPAIARDEEGAIHVALRTGGNFDGGYTLGYQRREADGTWSSVIEFGAPAQWNWQVGVAPDGDGGAYVFATTTGGNVWADLNVFHATAGVVQPLTQISGWYRVDNVATLRGDGARVVLAAGDNSQPMRMGWGLADAELANGLSKGTVHNAGPGDHGFPSLDFDSSGTLHVSYGSGFTDHNQFPAVCPNCVAGQVHYFRVETTGTVIPGSERTVLTDLDTWHLSIGISAVAASEDGLNVVVAGLQTHDMKAGEASSLLTTFSNDGGATWSPALDTGRSINAGEGRLLPRMVGLGDRVHLFVSDNAAPGQISLSVMEFPSSGTGGTGGGTGGDATTGADGLSSSGTGATAGGVDPGVDTGSTDGGTSGAAGSGLGPPSVPSPGTSGCACQAAKSRTSSAWLGLLLLGLYARRRDRRV